MTRKVGPNEPCPCGSGKKFKKCCGAVGANALAAGASYDRKNRDSASAMVERLVEAELSYWGDEEEVAEGDGSTPSEKPAPSLEARFWGEYMGCALPEVAAERAEGILLDWVAFDVLQKNGERLVDQLLRRKNLRAGEKTFLEAMKHSAMKLYEVVEDLSTSVILRDLVDGGTAVVHQHSTGSSKPTTGFWVARVVPCGVSGKPELEGAVLLMPDVFQQFLIDKVLEHRRFHALTHPGASALDADKELPPFFHQLWLKTYFSQIEKMAKEAGQ
jgi:SEC-C motif